MNRKLNIKTMKKSIYFLFATIAFSFYLTSCHNPTQKKVDVSKLKGADIFLGKWINKERNFEIMVRKQNDSIYEVFSPGNSNTNARLTVTNGMSIESTYNDGKLMNGKDWIVLKLVNNYKVIYMDKIEMERED